MRVHASSNFSSSSNSNTTVSTDNRASWPNRHTPGHSEWWWAILVQLCSLILSFQSIQPWIILPYYSARGDRLPRSCQAVIGQHCSGGHHATVTALQSTLVSEVYGLRQHQKQQHKLAYCCLALSVRLVINCSLPRHLLYRPLSLCAHSSESEFACWLPLAAALNVASLCKYTHCTVASVLAVCRSEATTNPNGDNSLNGELESFGAQIGGEMKGTQKETEERQQWH